MSEQHHKYLQAGWKAVSEDDYERADILFGEAFDEAVAKDLPDDIAESFSAVIQASIMRDDYDAIENYSKTFLPKARQFWGDHINTAGALMNLGGAAFHRGDYDVALKWLIESRDMMDRCATKNIQRTFVLRNIAKIHMAQGHPYDALEALRAALKWAEELHGYWHQECIMILTLAGEAAWGAHEDALALQHLNDGLERSLTSPTHWEIMVKLLKSLGVIHLSNKRFTQADRCLTQALNIQPDNSRYDTPTLRHLLKLQKAAREGIQGETHGHTQTD